MKLINKKKGKSGLEVDCCACFCLSFVFFNAIIKMTSNNHLILFLYDLKLNKGRCMLGWLLHWRFSGSSKKIKKHWAICKSVFFTLGLSPASVIDEDESLSDRRYCRRHGYWGLETDSCRVLYAACPCTTRTTWGSSPATGGQRGRDGRGSADPSAPRFFFGGVKG